MLSKFTIDYVIFPQHNSTIRTHFADDPIEAEEFIMSLLMLHARITAIRHEGGILTQHQFDRMLKIAAERIVSQLLAESIQVDASDIKNRFGFAA